MLLGIAAPALFLGRAHAGVLVGPPVPAVLYCTCSGIDADREPVAVALAWPHCLADAPHSLEIVLDGVSGRQAHEVVAAVAARAAKHGHIDGGGVGGGAIGGGEVGGEVRRSRRFEVERFGDSGGRCPSLTTKRRDARLRLLLLLLLLHRRRLRRRRCVRRGGSTMISRELGRVDREIGERNDGARRSSGASAWRGGGRRRAARRHRTRRHPGRQAGRQAGGGAS